MTTAQPATVARRRAELNAFADERLAAADAEVAMRREAAEAAAAAAERRSRKRAVVAAERRAYIDAVAEAETAMTGFVAAMQEAERHRSAAAQAAALAGDLVGGISQEACHRRLSAYLADALAKISGSPARIGQIQLRGTGKHYRGWANAEAAALAAKPNDEEDSNG